LSNTSYTEIRIWTLTNLGREVGRGTDGRLFRARTSTEMKIFNPSWLDQIFLFSSYSSAL
jgi:hypothetical protein